MALTRFTAKVILLFCALISGTAAAPSSPRPLPINIAPRPGFGDCSAYIFGQFGGVAQFLNQNSQYQPAAGVDGESAGVTAHPVGSSMTLPGDLASARIYVVCGRQYDFIKQGNTINPAFDEDARWSYVEFTYSDGVLYVNLSAVDGISNPVLGYKIEGGHTGKQIWGPKANAVVEVCSMLEDQGRIDGRPWGKLCQRDGSGQVLRVNSPASHLPSGSSSFDGYFDAYTRSVYTQWNTQPRTFNLGNQNVTCVGAADGSSATCNGRVYGIPTAADVFGCASGPFAPDGDATHQGLRPSFCAAFNRGTLRDGTDEANAPRNWYSYAVHKQQWGGGVGYAFPFDDVRVKGVSQDGTLVSNKAKGLTINVGGEWPTQ